MKVYEPPIGDTAPKSDATPKDKMKFINDYYMDNRISAIGCIALGSLNAEYERFYGKPCSKEDFDSALDALYSVVLADRKMHGGKNGKDNGGAKR